MTKTINIEEEKTTLEIAFENYKKALTELDKEVANYFYDNIDKFFGKISAINWNKEEAANDIFLNKYCGSERVLYKYESNYISKELYMMMSSHLTDKVRSIHPTIFPTHDDCEALCINISFEIKPYKKEKLIKDFAANYVKYNRGCKKVEKMNEIITYLNNFFSHMGANESPYIQANYLSNKYARKDISPISMEDTEVMTTLINTKTSSDSSNIIVLKDIFLKNLDNLFKNTTSVKNLLINLKDYSDYTFDYIDKLLLEYGEENALSITMEDICDKYELNLNDVNNLLIRYTYNPLQLKTYSY